MLANEGVIEGLAFTAIVLLIYAGLMSACISGITGADSRGKVSRIAVLAVVTSWLIGYVLDSVLAQMRLDGFRTLLTAIAAVLCILNVIMKDRDH